MKQFLGSEKAKVQAGLQISGNMSYGLTFLVQIIVDIYGQDKVSVMLWVSILVSGVGDKS